MEIFHFKRWQEDTCMCVCVGGGDLPTLPVSVYSQDVGFDESVNVTLHDDFHCFSSYCRQKKTTTQ